MALTADDLKAHLNGVDEGDEPMLPRLLAAAISHVEAQLGFKLDDDDEFPDGTPADLDQAVLMLAAHWYENREGTITGTIIAEVPMGVAEIIANRRGYTFG
jgi:hypothetical protein